MHRHEESYLKADTHRQIDTHTYTDHSPHKHTQFITHVHAQAFTTHSCTYTYTQREDNVGQKSNIRYKNKNRGISSLQCILLMMVRKSAQCKEK